MPEAKDSPKSASSVLAPSRDVTKEASTPQPREDDPAVTNPVESLPEDPNPSPSDVVEDEAPKAEPVKVAVDPAFADSVEDGDSVRVSVAGFDEVELPLDGSEVKVDPAVANALRVSPAVVVPEDAPEVALTA